MSKVFVNIGVGLHGYMAPAAGPGARPRSGPPPTRLILHWAAAAGLLVLLCAAAAVAQTPLVVSPRVGDEIGPPERAYFGLFPGRDPFESARFDAEGDSVRVTVLAGGTATAWRIGRARATALGAYLEAFEGLDAPYLHPQWQLLRGASRDSVVDPSVPTPGLRRGGRADVRVRVGGRQLYDGALLAASDTLLLLHPAGQAYDWRAPAVLALDPAGVDWVSVLPARERFANLLVRGGILFAGVALALPFALDGSLAVRKGGEGALIGGLMAGYIAGQAATNVLAPSVDRAGPYAEVLPTLRARARFRFPADLTPEEAAARGRGSTAIAPEAVAVRPGSLAWRFGEWRRAHGWVSVSVLGPGTWSARPAGGQTFRETVFTGTASTVEAGVEYPAVVPSGGLELALRPVPWVRGGLVWMRHAADEPEPHNTQVLAGGFEAARTQPAGLRGHAEVVLPTPRLHGFGLDVALGAGTERNRVAVEREAFIGTRPVGYSYEQTARGTFLQASAELVTPRHASFFVRYTRHPELPSIDVEAAVVGEPGFPPVYTREAHTVAFGSIREVMFGTRWRF